MRKIGVFGSEFSVDKFPIINDLFAKLKSLNAAVFLQSSFRSFLSEKFDFHPETDGTVEDSLEDVEMALSIGGDGTFLRTALIVSKSDIPILGINIGRLGFLADTGRGEIGETLEEIFRGEYRIEKRSVLKLCTEHKVFSGFNYALNEVAILKRETSSMITIHAYLNDDYLTSYQADGLIISTPTGSTAYSMSVNGPILLPENNNFVLSPVAPHSLTTRPIVIPDNYHVMLKIESRINSFLVSLDGRSEAISTDISLKISKADFSTGIIKRLNHTFYQTLREKLMWGKDVRS
ncbi:MAG: NAD kinase [Tannerella sp.]|jgi:NAD+ kinase|nr:NAD kinase [Tannerella sp.]